MTKLYLAVSGNPISHSKSPQMMNAALAHSEIDGAYLRLAARTPQEALRLAKTLGLSGLNITAPFKEPIIDLLDDLSEEVREIGAVNTITIKDGRTKGYNTDAIGVRRALEENGISLEGKTVIIIGAGGAARAAAFGLSNSGASVIVSNRTLEKAKTLTEKFKSQKFSCEACPLEGEQFTEAMKAADVIISTLSTAERVVNSNLLNKNIVLFDAVYGQQTALTSDAIKASCKIISGQEWLLHQGAKGFELFTGRTVPVDVLRNGLKSEKMTKQNIALIGFVGVGKSSVTRVLAKLLAVDFMEMDAEIEKRAGKPVADIFRNEGEAEFRKMETELLAEITKQKGIIISCGGGVVTNLQNIEQLKQSCKVVFIHAELETIIQRIGTDKSRPLLNVKDRETKMHQMLEARFPLYAKCCDLVISSDDKTPYEIALLIANELGKGVKNE